MSGVLSTPSRSRSPPARSRSPAPRRLRPTKYYVCRAPEYLVGAGHGIHDSWDDIKKYLHRPASDVVRAAVAPNHKSFPRTAGGLEHAQAYLESPPELFLSGIQINAVGRVCLVFVGTIAIFYDMTPDGRYDPYSLHGGCPVLGEGDSVSTKWAANQWICKF